LLQEGLELVGSVSGRTNTVQAVWWWKKKSSATSLDTTILELGGPELTSGSSLLLQHLLLVRVGITNLHDMLLATMLGDWCVVQRLDDFFADVARFEAAFVSCGPL
jgi:hypothetical protein